MVSIEENELKKYELLLLFSPAMNEGERKEALEEMKKTIQENGGAVFFEDAWGLRKLAYRIKKNSEGFYAVLYFEADPQAILEMRTNVRLHPKILRHLLITIPSAYTPRAFSEMELMSGRLRDEKARVARRPKSETKEVVREIMEETPEEKLLNQKDEAKLKKVDKTLESILENPDIEIT